MELSLILSYLFLILIFLYLIYRRHISFLIAGRQKFKCTRCGVCCRLLVEIDDEDIRKIKDAGEKDFIAIIKSRKVIRQKNGACPFLIMKKDKSSCSIYKYRPKVCREFPEKRIFGRKGYDYRCQAIRLPKCLRYN